VAGVPHNKSLLGNPIFGIVVDKNWRLSYLVSPVGLAEDEAVMDALLFLAFGVLLLFATFSVCIRRGRHGGLAGGDSTSLAPPGVAEHGMGKVFRAEDVSRHNSQCDLWLIINRKVYDFSDVRYVHRVYLVFCE
jgi:Cytochrome b5-like Heme/Steroid binding domain